LAAGVIGISKVNNAHDRALKDSGITPLRLYDLRHTWVPSPAFLGLAEPNESGLAICHISLEKGTNITFTLQIPYNS
jgi:hypothetical protein